MADTPVTMSTPASIGMALESTGALSPVTVSDSRLSEDLRIPIATPAGNYSATMTLLSK